MKIWKWRCYLCGRIGSRFLTHAMASHYGKEHMMKQHGLKNTLPAILRENELKGVKYGK